MTSKFQNMKLILCLFVAVCAVNAQFFENKNKKYSRFIDFPGGDDVLYQVDLEEQPDINILEEVSKKPADNLYLLYTRKNPLRAQSLVINNASSLVLSNFNSRVPVVVIVHGWLGNWTTKINPVITDAYLRKSNVNVIVMDWSRLSHSAYVTAVLGVPSVGRGLGHFLSFLNRETGAPFTTMHLVGHSLGAHVVGNAGRELEARVARITGTDPAGPLWTFNPNCLGPSDGEYVEAIHTDGGLTGLGIGYVVANVDFFVNGGIIQPGCLTNLCNHNLAWKLFAATVTYNHLMGRQCDNMLEVFFNECTGLSLNMGNDNLNKIGQGIFRVNTNGVYPY